jgi:4'-phosphopantetheinyl transferase EntD
MAEPPAATHSGLTPAAIRSILPPGTAVETARVEDRLQSLYEVERQAVLRAVPSRQWEFATGRACARAALAALGAPPGPIPVGGNREPVWPAGFIGSITHDAGVCVAVARVRNGIRGIGIDLATAEPLPEEVRRLVCTDQELRRAPSPASVPDPFKLLFSAKEALYKAIYPEVRRYVDFLEVTVEMDHEANAWRPVFHSPDLARALDGRVQGSLLAADGFILTGAWVR